VLRTTRNFPTNALLGVVAARNAGLMGPHVSNILVILSVLVGGAAADFSLVSVSVVDAECVRRSPRASFSTSGSSAYDAGRKPWLQWWSTGSQLKSAYLAAVAPDRRPQWSSRATPTVA
jgi:hypothetical protein